MLRKFISAGPFVVNDLVDSKAAGMLETDIGKRKFLNKMNDLNIKLAKHVTVTNPLGLHARPAAMIARLAIKARGGVWLIKNGEHVDASSVIDILSLECTQGCSMTLKIENPSDIDILNGISTLFEKGFKD